MPRCLLLLGLLAGAPGALPAQSAIGEVYTVDEAHSLLDFTVRLVGFKPVRGTFGTWQADFLYDPAAPIAGFVSFRAKVASIATQIEERDQHLRSPDFFDAARFPWITFEGRVVTAAGSRLEVEGPLTIRGGTRTIRFPLELTTPEAIDLFGNRRLVFAGTVTLNRWDFGVAGPKLWNRAISDSVAIEMELEGRIWRYTTLGFRAGAYYGPMLVAAADAGRFDQASRRLRSELAAERDSTRLPSPLETEVAVGRLVQERKLREAEQLLELFRDVVERRWTAAGQSLYHTRLGEVFLRRGRTAEARQQLEQAITLDSTNTNARAWRAALPGTP